MKRLKILASRLDKILEKYFRAEYGDNFITFGTNPDDDIKIPNTICSYKEILSQLPEGWHPDILLIAWPEQGLFNFDIMEIDCLTVAVIMDWMHYYYAVKAVSQAFDVFIVLEKTSEKYLRQFGCANIYQQVYFCAYPEIFNIPEQTKKYDITFIGCINNRLWPKRSFLLERLALLGNKYNVNIQSGIWGEKYFNILKQSKIVFNCTVSEAINIRTFEGLSAGSFLLTNKNEEIVKYFQDNVHLGLYTDDNLEEKIEYYLQNDIERESIAKKGVEQVRQFHKAESRVKELIYILNSLDLEKQKYNRLKNKSDDTNLIQIAKSIILKGGFIDAISILSGLNCPTALNIMACNMFIMALYSVDLSDRFAEYQKSIYLLETIQDNIFVYLNLVTIYTIMGNYDKSHEYLFKAKEFLETHPDIKWDDSEIYLMDFDFKYEINFIKETDTISVNKDVFFHPTSHIIDQLYEVIDNSYYDILMEYLKTRIDFQIGLIYLFKNDFQKALNIFDQSLLSLENETELSFINYIKAVFFEITGDNENAYFYYKKAYSLKSFYMQARYNASRVLKNMGRSDESSALDSENELLNKYKDTIDYYR